MKKITSLIGVAALLGGCASVSQNEIEQVESTIDQAKGGKGDFGEYFRHSTEATCDAVSAERHLGMAKRYNNQLFGTSPSHLAEADHMAQHAIKHRKEADAVMAGIQASWDSKLAALESRVAANESRLSGQSETTTLANAPAGTAIRMEGVSFGFNSDELTNEAKNYLDSIVPEVLERGPSATLEVGGHSDNTGNHDYNVGLSQKRADAVREFLISRGVSAENISAVGYGPDSPVAENTTQAGRSLNRRVELILK